MREIKFRAWTGKTMFYQNDQYLGSFVRRAVPLIMEDHDIEEIREHESYLPNGGDIEEYLTQYTGLKDKNGKEIYEGDILSMFQGSQLSEVYYDQGCWWVMAQESGVSPLGESALFNMLDTGEVIGNIYENPELITKRR